MAWGRKILPERLMILWICVDQQQFSGVLVELIEPYPAMVVLEEPLAS